MAANNQAEFAGDDGVDLVRAMFVIRKHGAWRVHVTRHAIALRLELAPERRFGKFTVERGIPTVNGHLAILHGVAGVSCQLPVASSKRKRGRTAEPQRAAEP